MVNKVLYSSSSEDWSTPQELFDSLNDEFHFDLDVCATQVNAKCEKYFTKDIDGLSQKWYGNCWCNPPYGRTVSKWIQKAIDSSTLVVMLLPARTDTLWFHDLVLNRGEIRFIKGRLKFGNSLSPAPFPSMIVIFRP